MSLPLVLARRAYLPAIKPCNHWRCMVEQGPRIVITRRHPGYPVETIMTKYYAAAIAFLVITPAAFAAPVADTVAACCAALDACCEQAMDCCDE